MSKGQLPMRGAKSAYNIPSSVALTVADEGGTSEEVGKSAPRVSSAKERQFLVSDKGQNKGSPTARMKRFSSSTTQLSTRSKKLSFAAGLEPTEMSASVENMAQELGGEGKKKIRESESLSIK